MKILILLLISLSYSFSVYSQEIKISGKVTDHKGEALIYASVAIKGYFDGTTTNEFGKYSFKTNKKGKLTLVASYIGYEICEKEIVLEGDSLIVNLVLRPLATELAAVTIVAGSFEASDEIKTENMRPADIGTTAGALGDITGAIETLPGVQSVDNANGLFVRGGSGSESKIIIDEMEVQNPYYSPVPDVKQRGRFDPFMFSGTVFSSGGYSALYGQALSSTLVLKSKGLADSTNTGGGLYAYGTNLFHVHRWKNTSVYVKGEYNNLNPIHRLFQIEDWEKSPENFGGKLIFRHQFSSNDILKFYYNQSSTDLSLKYENADNVGANSLFKMRNTNLYINSSYKKYFKGDEWSVFLGTSYSKDKDIASLDDIDMSEDEKLIQGKLIITNQSLSNNTFQAGMELHNRIAIGRTGGLTGDINERYFACFFESNWFLTRKLAARIGVRHEYSGYLKKSNTSPRTSLAYLLGEYNQVSFAYGKFYQTPENEFLYYNNNLNFENATHYILNYQWRKNKKTFRVELFKKDYKNLIKDVANNNNYFNNAGSGYAKGIEVFYRDKGFVNDDSDFWVSYSYLDTKRDYRDFPIIASPTFAAKHTLSFVYKHWINKINSIVGLSYLYSSGRPYFNPNRPENEFHMDYTKEYHNLDINISKMVKIFGKDAVIHASLENVLGQKHILGYRYLPNDSGRIPIKPLTVRSFFIGCFISTY